jgi:hypothetical protein
MSWFLQIAGGPPQLFSDLGLVKLRRRIRSQQAGSFSFTADGADADSNPLAPEGTLCSVLLANADGSDAAPFFSGRLHRIPRSGSGSAESVDYELLDAWTDFERNVYQQRWNIITSVDEEGEPTLDAQYRSECILGMDLDGNAVSSGAVIYDVVTWAIGVGAYCQIGNIGVDAPVPMDEITDLPCSECVKKMLRLTPDAVTQFDYSTTPPTFNVVRRADCDTYEIPFVDGEEQVAIQALPDLVAPCVVITYIQENQTDGVPAINVIVDDYPEGSTGLEYGALVETTRLAGTQSTFEKQPVVTGPIPTNTTDNSVVALWLQQHVPYLTQFDADSLTVSDFSSVTVIPNPGPGTTPYTLPPTNPNVDTDPSHYPNELLSGSLPNWVLTNYNLITGQVTLTCTVTSTNFSGALPFSVTVRGTNATTTTYEQLSSYTDPEPVPAGLAEQIYGSLSVLQYEGSYTTVGSEVTPWSLGAVLNLTGGRAEWASMNALLQEIDDDLDNGRTTLKFGPAEHLTLQDLMEQLRANRTRVVSRHIKERQTGQPAAPQVDGAGVTSHSASSGQPAQILSPWAVTDASGESNLAVQVSAYSYLFSAPDIGATVNITGLDGAIDVSIGQYGYLEIDYNDDLSLNGDPGVYSGTWPADSGTLMYSVDTSGDAPYIDSWFVPIFKIVDQSDATPGTNISATDGTATGKIIQLLNTHLALQTWAVQGMLAQVPGAWSGTA